MHDTLIALAERLGVKNATLMWPVRIAVAGKLVTPGGAVELCHILGRDETLRRLRFGMKNWRADSTKISHKGLYEHEQTDHSRRL